MCVVKTTFLHLHVKRNNVEILLPKSVHIEEKQTHIPAFGLFFFFFSPNKIFTFHHLSSLVNLTKVDPPLFKGQLLGIWKKITRPREITSKLFPLLMQPRTLKKKNNLWRGEVKITGIMWLHKCTHPPKTRTLLFDWSHSNSRKCESAHSWHPNQVQLFFLNYPDNFYCFTHTFLFVSLEVASYFYFF